MGLIDFELDVYDYITFVILLGGVVAFFYVMVTLGGLPGKLAERRNHPHAEAVKLGGWIGLFTVFPWIHALMWAYHDGLTIDIRKMPRGAAKDGPAETAGGSAPHEAASVPNSVPAPETQAAPTAAPARDGDIA